MLIPKKVKHRKWHKGRRRGSLVESRGTKVSYGSYGLKALEASRFLLEQGFLIPAVRYPTVPKGKARLRITVSAAHTHRDIEKLLKAFQELWK